jgi:EmrB/QacA subfamily drug resistance transporter
MDETRKWWTLGAVAIGVFMLLLDITVVNVALPAIQDDLNASFSDLQWVIDAYALTLAALLLVSGSFADLIGRRKVFVIGLVLFAAASAACGLSQSPLWLILARAVQGIGGAMLFATSLALIAQAFRGPDRATAFGIYGATIGAAVAIGPLVGGALTDSLGWEWIFFVNVPIGIAAVFVSLAKIDESSDPHPAGIDWPGAVTFSGALFMLVFALIRGNEEGWGSTLIVALFAGAVVALVLFIVIELRSDHPMFELPLFRNRTFDGASIVAFALSAAMFSMFLYITLYIENVLGYKPLDAGLRFLPLTVASFLVAPTVGRLTETRGVPARVFLSGGLVLVGIGLLLMHGVKADSSWTSLLAGFCIAGAGIGMINPTLATTAVGVVAPQRSGMASGINNTFRQVGIATGIAALGAIFQSRIADKLATGLQGTPGAAHANDLAHGVASGGAQNLLKAVPPEHRQQFVHVANDAFVSGLNELFTVGAVIAFAGALLAALLVRQRDFVGHGQPEAERQPEAAAAAA